VTQVFLGALKDAKGAKNQGFLANADGVAGTVKISEKTYCAMQCGCLYSALRFPERGRTA